jgi:small GTP-binding protein
MNDAELLAIIEKAARAEVTSLDLSGLGIATIPLEILQISNLQTLELSRNKISVIPDAITQLFNLQKLYLRENQISVIPDEIIHLSNLKELSLAANQISVIPDAITQLSELQSLFLWDNQIRIIPNEIAKLSKLQELYLAGNQISAIPNEIAKLSNLLELDLENNQISVIPNVLVELTKLTKLDLRKNHLQIPPEILRNYYAPNVILNYLKNLRDGEKRLLNEAKVILVGYGSVGKTSLVRQLIDPSVKFKPNENKTEGIDIHQWKVKAKRELVRLRVWDFGGQEIMHATHQFFLTERSLYLLVLNARKDESNNDVEYWIKIIESFGKDAPVLVIANKSDEHALKLNRRHLQDKYPNIKGFFFTSCKTGEGIDPLRTAIVQQIEAMDHVFNLLPLQWFHIKEQIEKIDRDHISYTEYENLCATQGVTDGQDRRDLIQLLHMLGIVLNFSDDPRLQDTSVLNPEWVTGGVYRILNDNQLSTKHKGMLAWQDLERILKPKIASDLDCYKENRDRQFILEMMQKFELCFPIEMNSRQPSYLIPELLDEEEPDTGTWEDTLKFEYHYKVLFSGIISRFIVKMKHLISRRTYWRTGVILISKEYNRAYIKADLSDTKIFIRIGGNPTTRRAFLTAIRNTFDAIHHTISALEVTEEVPLPDNPTITVPYDYLCDLEREGILEFIPYGTRQLYEVRLLLDGIEDRRSRNERSENRGDTYHFYAETGQVITGNVKPAGNNIGTQNNNLSQNPAPEVSQPNKTSSATKPMKTILLLAANPKNTNPLRLQEEERDIKERLRLAGYGTEPIKSAVAVRPRDIQQSILDFDPQIIHFSGHGGDEAGLVFEDIDGNPKLISGEALADLFELFSDRLECVVLNACYSETQAHAISQHINYVIGMDRKIGDRAAIEFAVGFYTALGANKPYDFAFKLGCNAIRLAGIDEAYTPKLLKK